MTWFTGVSWKEALERLHKTNNFPGVYRTGMPGAL